VKKLGFILMAIAAIVVGMLVGTLNSSPVQLDLLWIQFELPLGLAILLGFSLGLVTGLSVLYLARVLPLRLQLRKARTARLKQESYVKQDPHDLSLPDD
jgi:putative membrane protein